MILHCLWNTCVKHIKASTVALLRLCSDPSLTLFTSLSQLTGFSSFQAAKQWHWLCSVNYLCLSAQPWVVCPLLPLHTVWSSVSERPLHSIQPSALWLIKFSCYFWDAFTYAVSHERLFFTAILPQVKAVLRHDLMFLKSPQLILEWLIIKLFLNHAKSLVMVTANS